MRDLSDVRLARLDFRVLQPDEDVSHLPDTASLTGSAGTAQIEEEGTGVVVVIIRYSDPPRRARGRGKPRFGVSVRAVLSFLFQGDLPLDEKGRAELEILARPFAHELVADVLSRARVNLPSKLLTFDSFTVDEIGNESS